MWFTIISLSIIFAVAWAITRCGWPERAPMRDC